MSQQSEGRLQAKIVKALNALPGCLFQKIHGSAYGKPSVDLSGAVYGRRCEIEVKMPGKQPTERQHATLKKWEDVGCIVGWATSIEEAKQIVKPYL